MDGFELSRHIQHAYPTTKVVLMTGFARDELQRIGGDLGSYRIIFKPFKSDSLLQMIQNMLEDSSGPTGGVGIR
jgi:CheY-like chemotaxis protein